MPPVGAAPPLRHWESEAASNIILFWRSTMSFASPISSDLSKWSKVIIVRHERFQGSRRRHSEIYLPIGAFVWPCLRHKSAASSFCERRFNLIKSRLMEHWLAWIELQQRLSEGREKNYPPSWICHCPVKSKWNTGGKTVLVFLNRSKCTLKGCIQLKKRVRWSREEFNAGVQSSPTPYRGFTLSIHIRQAWRFSLDVRDFTYILCDIKFVPS